MGTVRRLTDGSPSSRLTLVLDLVALPLFVVVGMASHDADARLAVFLRNTVPVVGAWLVVAWLAGTYRPPTLTGMIKTWAIAVPIGLVVRTAIAGTLDDSDVWVFFGVAMAFTLAFLAAGRALSTLVGSRMGRRA
jgi:Cu/Ag efflux pump CusA